MTEGDKAAAVEDPDVLIVGRLEDDKEEYAATYF